MCLTFVHFCLKTMSVYLEPWHDLQKTHFETKVCFGLLRYCNTRRNQNEMLLAGWDEDEATDISPGMTPVLCTNDTVSSLEQIAQKILESVQRKGHRLHGAVHRLHPPLCKTIRDQMDFACGFPEDHTPWTPDLHAQARLGTYLYTSQCSAVPDTVRTLKPWEQEW